MRRTLLLPLLLLGVSCGEADVHGDLAGHEHHGGHVHSAPRGGALVVLAEETAHVEVILDSDTGHLAIYVLGPHAEAPVRVTQETLSLTLQVAGTEHRVTLPAIASELTGETVGDSSEFSADVEALKGVQAFTGTIDEVSARGSTYSGVAITYP